jgi:hypothetical protein
MFDISLETLWVKMHLYSLKTKIYVCCAQLVKWTVCQGLQITIL